MPHYLESDLKLSGRQKDRLKELLKEGDWIYCPFRCVCGYRRNVFYKHNGKWKKLTICPKCKRGLPSWLGTMGP